MKQFLVQLFFDFFSFLDAGWCFLITLFIIISVFCLKLVFALKGENKTFFNGVNLICISLILFEAFSLLVVGDNLSFAIFSFALYELSLAPFYFIVKKQKVIVLSKEQKEVVNKLEQKVKEENVLVKEEKKSVLYDFKNALEEEKVEIKKTNVKPILSKVEKDKVSEYKGVKEAIEKTLLKKITDDERRKLIALEISILQMEKGEENMMLKNEVNEGLSSLLKIMSKYAV